MHRVRDQATVLGDEEAHKASKVNFGEPCPNCGSATQLQVHCKLYCSSCRLLLSNCNGD